MKKSILTAAGLCIALLPQAAPLTPGEALDRALGNVPAKLRAAGGNSLRLAATRNSDSNREAIYLFTPADGQGFIAVSADDAAPALVGYGTEPLSTADGEMAPGMEYWLSEMARQVDYAARHESHRSIPRQARPHRSPIEPLCATRWNQGDPYNYLCPKSGTTPTYTGCVATAMAQVMKYHNWPDTGTGSHAYKWGNRQLSFNYSKVSYNWDQMLDAYDDTATSEQKLSVAMLMQAAGYSVDMNYSTSGSGAQSNKIAYALGTYFRYNKSLRYLQRDYYSLYDWEDIIYSSLVNDGPVIYDGQSYDGGHSFVCDGYDKDGYFHFNWGWGGTSDGYFLLDLLDPISQGIGGSGDNSGFDFMQDIIVGIRPDRDGQSTDWNEMMVMNGGLNLSVGTDQSVKVLVYEGFVYNPGPAAIKDARLGYSIAEVDEAGNITGGMDFMFDIEELPLGYGYSSFSANCFGELKDGDYVVTMQFTDSKGHNLTVPAPVYSNTSTRMHIENGEVTFTPDEPELPMIAEVSYPETIEIGTAFQITGRIVSESDRDYYSQLTPLIVNEDSDVVAMGQSIAFDVEANGEYLVNYHSPLLEVRDVTLTPGDYYIVLCSQNSSHYLTLGDPEPVKIKANSGVESVGEDFDETVGTAYYTVSGTPAGRERTGLAPGIYIERRGAKAKKVIVK